MAVAHRIESLKSRHAALETALHEAECHPWTNENQVLSLKRDKLRLKDEIQRLSLYAGDGGGSAEGHMGTG